MDASGEIPCSSLDHEADEVFDSFYTEVNYICVNEKWVHRCSFMYCECELVGMRSGNRCKRTGILALDFHVLFVTVVVTRLNA